MFGSLSIFNSVVVHKSIVFRIKNNRHFLNFLSISSLLGFFVVPSRAGFLLVRLIFNSTKLITKLCLFLKKSKTIFINHIVAKKLVSMSPSVVFLLLQSDKLYLPLSTLSRNKSTSRLILFYY